MPLHTDVTHSPTDPGPAALSYTWYLYPDSLYTVLPVPFHRFSRWYSPTDRLPALPSHISMPTAHPPGRFPPACLSVCLFHHM